MAIPELYKDILARYVNELREAKASAIAWWDEIVVDQFIRMGMSKAESEHQARMRWPLGPTSYPRVLAVFRKFFYATNDLNELTLSGWEGSANILKEIENYWGTSDGDETERKEIMAPRVLLLSSLLEVDPELGEFMRYLVFLPIGGLEDQQPNRRRFEGIGEPLIFHNQQMGASRLLEQAADLCFPAVKTSSVLQRSSVRNKRYSKLYEEYKVSLYRSRAISIEWWNALVNNTTDRIGDPAKALRENYMLRPAGPASHPAVVSTVREFWCSFNELANEIADQERLPPSANLLAWLIEDRSSLSDILTGMPYWPIGLDKNGNWC